MLGHQHGCARLRSALPRRELIAAVAGKDKLVLVTFANHHFGDFARNWVSHVRALGLANYLVGAMDDRLLQVCHIGSEFRECSRLFAAAPHSVGTAVQAPGLQGAWKRCPQSTTGACMQLCTKTICLVEK